MTLADLPRTLTAFARQQRAPALLTAALAVTVMLPNTLQCWRGQAGGIADCTLSAAPQALGVAVVLWLMLLAAAISNRWLPVEDRARRRGLAIQVVGLTLVSLAVAAAVLLLAGSLGGGPGPYDIQMHATMALCACLGIEFHQRARAQHSQARQLHMAQEALVQQLDAANLQLLQAQVEPHFLFNTLAHLRRLAQTDPAAARAMLADLLRYLQEALPSLSQAHTTFGRELTLVRAYLALHQVRMGAQRLRLRYDIEPGLEDIPLPANSLLTLVENAIKHGIAPLVGGGEIAISARRQGERVQLAVADTGRGMGESSGHGTGLATLRARLAAQKGADGRKATLSLHLNAPRGLVATLDLPT